MTLYDFWLVCKSPIYIITEAGVVPYTGGKQYAYWYIVSARARSNPFYGDESPDRPVIVVTIRNH